jgi:AraC-like DNA-binding protein
MVRTTAAYGVIEFFQRSGLDPDTVLRSVGLLREELMDPTGEISLLQYYRMFEVAASMAGRSNLGLEFGVNFLPQHLGHLGYLSVTAPTIGRALRCMADKLPFHQQATFLGLETFGSSRLALSYVVVDDSVRERRQDAEFSLTVLMNLLRQALGPGWYPNEVHFSHGRPDHLRAHERIFGSSIRFDEEANRIVFSKDLLEVSMPRRDDVLHGLLKAEIVRQRKLGGYNTDIIASVRYQIERLLPKGNCELENAASMCGIPPWSLKRKLRARGLSFQDLVLAVRQELAPLYLLKRGMPATQVALCLGYSELSAFSRAFRQWTGVSPRDFVHDATRGASDSHPPLP